MLQLRLNDWIFPHFFCSPFLVGNLSGLVVFYLFINFLYSVLNMVYPIGALEGLPIAAFGLLGGRQNLAENSSGTKETRETKQYKNKGWYS